MTLIGLKQRPGFGGRWMARAAEYLEIAETKLIGAGQFVEDTLTMLSGFSFAHDHPFTYLEGKRVLELALGDARIDFDLRIAVANGGPPKCLRLVAGSADDPLLDG